MQNNKHRKLKTIQMNYPAPYSHSWANSDPARFEMDKMRKCSSFQRNMTKQNQPICNCYWRRPKPLTRGTNPYAPHLKYGLFPKKVNPGESLERPAKDENVPRLPLKNKKPLQDRFIRDRKKGDMKEKRAIDKECPRQLSLSQMSHVDIKPGAIASRPQTFY
ncbi:uncharacterized protein LOC112051219 [Bicyclus anynana]|uniref:Uncharacterized protein LOC112051219 n=1 Tax=Bicyclus anynana TaxID=110368 RepID=A0A6J1NKK8_BICAN|nr:uncharacterized protein LOC112051219 [Bicyclus anynana]